MDEGLCIYSSLVEKIASNDHEVDPAIDSVINDLPETATEIIETFT
jgi:hypothetical protein